MKKKKKKMKCTECQCVRYVPDEDLVMDDWKLNLKESEWCADFFEDFEKCASCTHAPRAHGTPACEARVVSAAHLTDYEESAETYFVKQVNLGDTTPTIFLKCMNETNFTHVGLQLWRCSVVMAEYILSNKHLITNGILWEVGAGVGLPSLAASKTGHTVWCTDMQQAVLNNLKEEMELNNISRGFFKVKKFDFTDLSIGQATATGCIGWEEGDEDAAISCIMCSDVIFSEEVTLLFLKFLQTHFCGARPAPCCILSYDRRAGQRITAGTPPCDFFFSSLPSYNLHHTDIPLSTVPQLCTSIPRSLDVGLVKITPATDVP
eukprot:TRINITY_DN5284_c0_g3_i1.p1 TRINITY_DN5284_c0_g3~~TRINITY_DN5284_c0_g3_i1.p1  ORF type:complete len:328 (+),score=53.67 TRINITY_DN5284_c0_g3_i1:27-986(+)